MKFQEFKKIPRLSREMIITEKIDGTNASISIFNILELTPEELAHPEISWIDISYEGSNFIMIAGSRNRYISTVQENAGFAHWVKDNKDDLIKLGTGIHYGEWWGKGIQRGYGLKEKKFSLFNVSRWDDPTTRPECCDVVPTLYTGIFSTNMIDIVIGYLAQHGSTAAPGYMKPEGIVIFHTAGGYMFKKTIENDESPKSLVKEE